MIRDLHRINSHIVSAGYPIVEAGGPAARVAVAETGEGLALACGRAQLVSNSLDESVWLPLLSIASTSH